MPRLLVLRECQLPQEQIDRVSGKPLEGERPKNKTGVPVQSSNKEPQIFGSRLYQRHRSLADMRRALTISFFVMANTAANTVSANLISTRPCGQSFRRRRLTSSVQASASDTLGRIAAYVGYLFEDISDEQGMKTHHFECSQPASRGLNRPYELGELMSLTYPH